MNAYAAILTRPGAARFSATALLSRLPISMAALGIVLLVTEQTGSYGRAGIVSATYVLAAAAFAPVHGRLADRWGQGPVLWATGAVFAVGVVALLSAVGAEAAFPWPHAAAALAGLSTPQAGSMVRTRWTHLLADDRDRLTTAFALEAVADEVVFIVGPVLVTFLTLHVASFSGLAAAAGAGLVGSWLLAAQRSTAPPPRPRQDGARPPMGWAVLAPVLLAALGIGAMFGSTEVVVVAFTTEQGDRSWAGAVLAVWAGASLLAGVLVGILPPPGDPVVRLRWTLVVLATLFLPLYLAPSTVWFALGMFLAGFMIAPSLIAAMSIIELHVHPSRLTEGLTWTSTALSAGLALGAGLVGWIVDGAGARAGLTVPLVAAAAAAAVAWSFHPRPPADRGLVPGPMTH